VAFEGMLQKQKNSNGYLWEFFMYRGKDERRPNNI
jgi:hypothetical protein